jgi:uncharacterized RDD family membrane protein YckC
MSDQVAETEVTVDSEASSDTHAYAHFTRRIQGVFIDAIIFMVILAAALMLAVSFASDHVARILGATVVVTWLFYEPLLVSLTGGTIGHYLCNMRVVDDRGGNVSFIKAFARMIIKSLLGWYSFLAMAMTSRHQAVHDLLTRSTVQMRDLTKAALPFQGSPESADTAGHALADPARGRDRGLSGRLLYDVFDRSCDARPCRRPLQALH